MKIFAVIAAVALVGCGKMEPEAHTIKPTEVYNGCVRASVNALKLSAEEIITACEARQRRAEALVNSLKVEK